MFGYEVDVEISRDTSAFLPGTLLDNDPDDDTIVMARHWDNEDSLILLSWGRIETLKLRVASQEKYFDEAPEKLGHLAARPINELIDLGPNTAYTNQKPENSLSLGDRVKKRGDRDVSAAVVVEVLPPEQNTGTYGVEIEGETVNVAFPSSLDGGPRNWETIRPVLYTSYCYYQNIRSCIYKHSNPELAEDKWLRLGRRHALGMASSG